jgi:hypothetical protein
VCDLRRLLAGVIACTICWFSAVVLAPPLAAQEYPVVYDSPSKLAQLGIAVSFGKQVPPLKNKCYYYGDGGYLISTSDEFYNRFKRRGFSIEAMCLGLVSTTHYDPETGRRLPTYILVDRALVKTSEPGAVTDELPLDLPDCFKNANPYTDCHFRYGRVTGKALTAAETETYQRLGAAIDKAMMPTINDVAGTQGFFGSKDGEELIKGFRVTGGYSLPAEVDAAIPEELRRYSSASIWVCLSALPRGCGYGLDADGAAGPEVNPVALRAATAGMRRPQVDPQRLRQILESNR